MSVEVFRHRNRPEATITPKLTVLQNVKEPTELEDGPKSSHPVAKHASAPGLGLWLFAAYASFGAWLFHSFAVKFFLFSVQRLLAKFLARA